MKGEEGNFYGSEILAIVIEVFYNVVNMLQIINMVLIRL